MEIQSITPELEEKGLRLDKVILNHMPDRSRTEIQKWIKAGQVIVNDNVEKANYKVEEEDVIQVTLPDPQNTEINPENIPLDIVYEDEYLLVVNKPSGMVVHPGCGNRNHTLVNALMHHSKLSNLDNIRPGIVHRLDKDTSGLLIVAKNDLAHMNMSKQIQDRKVTKKYIALVRGIVPEDEATIDMPIARSQKDRKKMAVDKNGKEAVTHFKVLARYDKYTLLEVKIDTGRTHQIRVHMSYIGHPVVGDEVYSNGKNEFRYNK